MRQFEAREAVEAYEKLIKTNYTAYVYYVNEKRWIPSKLGKYLTSKVQEFIERETGNAFDILVLSVPPQHGKSLSITEALPSFYLMRNPKNRVIEISYSEDFAKLFGRRNKQKIQEYGKIFGIELASYPNSSTEFELSNNIGGMISRGCLSGVTGRPANLMIIDDPIKTSKEANSQSYRDSLWNEWLGSFRTRLAAGAKVIVIQTRWHEDDLAGRLIENEENVEVINIPCEAEENDPLGRDIGEALAPEIGKGDEWLMSFKKGYVGKEGSMAWNALFQGRPAAMEGNLIKRDWWKYYDELPNCTTWIMSVDATFKDKEDSDFVAIQVWAKQGVNMYLVDAIKKRLDFTQTINAIVGMKNRYPLISGVLIEDKANGSAIISILKKQMLGIIPINPNGGKFSRASAVTPYIESGNVWLPKFGMFTEDFINECAVFPNGAHDDQVDAMTQALTRLSFFTSKEKEKPPIMGAFGKYFNKPKFGRGEKIDVI